MSHSLIVTAVEAKNLLAADRGGLSSISFFNYFVDISNSGRKK